VLAANGVETFIQLNDGFTPTPVISRAILVHNRGRSDSLADGIVITPSHNPPADGGLKYNPPNGGPADTDVTDWIQNRANELLCAGNGGVQRIGFDVALNVSTTHAEEFVTPYVEDLANVIDLEAIRSAGLKIGVDPLGGAAAAYWQPLAKRYGIDIAVVNPKIDPTFAFMTLDHDGKIRMDCSSPRHGEHLQTLCREHEKRRPSRRHCRAGAGDRQPLSRREVSRVLRILRVTPEIAAAGADRPASRAVPPTPTVSCSRSSQSRTLPEGVTIRGRQGSGRRR
jgi:alpha-D-glucose phosphate-specific phosphoglucomutase